MTSADRTRYHTLLNYIHLFVVLFIEAFFPSVAVISEAVTNATKK